MGEQTKIEWTDETSTPSARIMTRDESPWPSLAIEERESLSAPAGAGGGHVRLAYPTQIRSESVLGIMSGARQDLQVFSPVVGLIPVDVVDYLTPSQRATERFGSNEAVLVDVPAGVCHWVPWHSNQVVTARRKSASTTPLPVLLAGIPCAHSFSVARGCV